MTVNNEMRNDTKNEMNNDTKNEMRNNIKNEMRNDTKNEMRNDTKNEMRNDTKNEMRNDTKNEMRNNVHEAKYYTIIAAEVVRCELCPRYCTLSVGKTGFCGARKNVAGKLFSLNYGRVSSLALDPIEKKPLRRFMPGAMILSCGSFGCNLACDFCQNHSIAQDTPYTVYISPEEMVAKALELKASDERSGDERSEGSGDGRSGDDRSGDDRSGDDRGGDVGSGDVGSGIYSGGSIGLAYTYNEPSIWFEYVYDCAVLAKSKGLINVLVTNGLINEKPLEEILPLVSAMNIDLKGTGEFYRTLCGASAGYADIIKANIIRASQRCHVEVTMLVVPGWNDDISIIESTADWLASVPNEIPLHLSRYFPNNRMRNSLPTSREFMMKAADVARRRLKYVYTGNM